MCEEKFDFYYSNDKIMDVYLIKYNLLSVYGRNQNKQPLNEIE